MLLRSEAKEQFLRCVEQYVMIAFITSKHENVKNCSLFHEISCISILGKFAIQSFLVSFQLLSQRFFLNQIISTNLNVSLLEKSIDQYQIGRLRHKSGLKKRFYQIPRHLILLSTAISQAIVEAKFPFLSGNESSGCEVLAGREIWNCILNGNELKNSEH